MVNVDPQRQNGSNGTTLHSSPSKKLVANLQEAPSLGYDVSQLYETQKSSPPSTPQAERQGWSDLDAVPSEFLDKVVPDWKVTFSRSDSTASTQSRRLADIKARIKKSGKGFVVRLLKGSNMDTDEVAEVHLGQTPVDQLPTLPELDCADLPVELGTDNATVPVAGNPCGEIFEIGTSGEPGVERRVRQVTTSAASSIPQWLSQTSSESGPRLSIGEDNFSDAETLLPDVRSIADRTEDHTDIEPLSTYSSVLPTRSSSVLSIVKTPTRGLSVVGPVRRVEKGNRVRVKGKTARADLNRAGARKSFIGRSPKGSISESLDSEHTRNTASATVSASVRAHGTHSDSPSYNSSSDEDDVGKYNVQGRRTQTDKRESSGRELGCQSSAPAPVARSKGLPRLKTAFPYAKSANTSPVRVRKTSPRDPEPAKRSPTGKHVSPSYMPEVDPAERSPVWSEMDPAHAEEIREALEVAFGTVAENFGVSRDQSLRSKPSTRSIPRIREPNEVGEDTDFVLPPGLEIRSAPTASGNRFSMFFGLALGAVLDKAVAGLGYLRDTYGSEPPVAPNHVRVRWTCVSNYTAWSSVRIPLTSTVLRRSALR